MAELAVEEFSLEAIALSGQVFTWHRLGKDRYRIASGTRVCVAQQRGSTLRLTCQDGFEPSDEDLARWCRYLALDDDYPAMLEELRVAGMLADEVYGASRGIRVLHQDWWDAAVSFVISQNSNIVRIQRTVDELMARGEPAGCVPQPARLVRLLADPDVTERLRLGYREPYLRLLAECAAAGWKPLSLARPFAPLQVQMRELEGLRGVGPKVASCICLYGLGYLESVPHDTWIKRAEREHKILWHPRLGGVQQQLVFAWIRGLG